VDSNDFRHILAYYFQSPDFGKYNVVDAHGRCAGQKSSLEAVALNRNDAVGRENFNAKAQIRTNYEKTLRVGRKDPKKI
jgi:hypothetical protein